MARKITMGTQSSKSVAEVFGDFVVSKMAQGLPDITIDTYCHHIHSTLKMTKHQRKTRM